MITRLAIAALIFGHGLIHFLGSAKGFGFAEVRALVEPVSVRQAAGWLVAGLSVAGSAVALLVAPRVWWIGGLVAVVLSQSMVFSAWTDAKAGTVANVLLLLLALHGFASEGPSSLRAEYRRAVQDRAVPERNRSVVTEEDLTPLPEPVRRYLRRAGVVGQPRVSDFRATWKGRIRSTPDEPWMAFTAEQFNVVDGPSRFFLMRARRAGLPVDVLHRFEDARASMRVRLLSVATMADARGADLTRAETVTLLNDLSILAPGALIDARIRWEGISDDEARAHFSVDANTISALLSFNAAGDLIDFVSDDRLVASSDGTTFTRQRWSTPLSDHRDVGPWHLAGRGEGWWHPEDGADFPYIELELLDVEVNPHGS